MGFTVRLGNATPIVSKRLEDGSVEKTPHDLGDLEETVTTIEVPHDDLMVALTEITSKDGVHGFHFQEDTVPTWVECDEVPAVAQMLSAHWGCPVRTGADLDKEPTQ